MIDGSNTPIKLIRMTRLVLWFVPHSIPLLIAMYTKEVKPALDLGRAVISGRHEDCAFGSAEN
jgi:hypothetical protein